MKKSVVSIITLFVLLSTIVILPQTTNAQTTPNQIFIRQDGGVEGTNLIQRSGDLYTFTADVAGSIVIEKNNVVLDGNGFTLQADADGFTIEDQTNVTIRDLSVNADSGTGMLVNRVSSFTVHGVTLYGERAGIRARNLTVSVIVDCQIEANVEYALVLAFSPGTVVANNTIISHMVDAVNCGYSPNPLILGNNIVYQASEFPLAAGIQFDGSTNCTICQNHIDGFPMTGINLQGQSNNNTLLENDVVNCNDGIRVSSNQNILTKNYVANCSGDGISLASSHGNLLRDNRLVGNGRSLAVGSYSSGGWFNDVDGSNWVDGNPVVYWINETGKVVPSDAGCVILVNCTDITVQNQSFTGKGDAVLMVYTQNSTVTNNYASENSTIRLYSSSDNTITNNQFTNNDKGLSLESSSFNNLISGNNFTANNYGIYLSSSSSNTITQNTFTENQNAIHFSSANDNNIFLNNFQTNPQQVSDSGMTHLYASVAVTTLSHNSEPLKVQPLACVTVEPANFVGPPPLSANNWDNGAQGNYWSDYNGTDKNGDGVGDTAFFLYGNNQDNYPLIAPCGVDATMPSPSSSVNASSSPSPSPSESPQPSPSIPEFPVFSMFVLLIGAVCVSFMVKRRGKNG
ncbi:MAG: right-handed parallel beta-helix repeat-containing protein [Candidatus Bathyarchaeota archaeon]|nr:right-handed parallel beta-helix repeat-containing protein [Candidatus Bathyarchaeota archaeon]